MVILFALCAYAAALLAKDLFAALLVKFSES